MVCVRKGDGREEEQVLLQMCVPSCPSQHTNKHTPLQHTTQQEVLARGALHDARLALALSSLEKASTPPSTTSGMPPCFAYSPTALRLRHRVLAATERQTLDPATSVVGRWMDCLCVCFCVCGRWMDDERECGYTPFRSNRLTLTTNL